MTTAVYADGLFLLFNCVLRAVLYFCNAWLSPFLCNAKQITYC